MIIGYIVPVKALVDAHVDVLGGAAVDRAEQVAPTGHSLGAPN